MKFTNKVYDVLKWVCLIALPALSALYFSVASVWNLPYAGEVTGTLAAIGTFLGGLIGISTLNFNKEE